MIEEWKDIKGYEGHYQISNKGNVKSLKRIVDNGRGKYTRSERMLKQHINQYGYYTVCLIKDKAKKNLIVHRLVAEAFLPNKNNFPQVNHKDENKANNQIENLEWCTAQYNSAYGTRPQRLAKNNYKSVSQYTIDGKYVATYESIQDAAKAVDGNGSHIGSMCNKKAHFVSAYGYKWSYLKRGNYNLTDAEK